MGIHSREPKYIWLTSYLFVGWFWAHLLLFSEHHQGKKGGHQNQIQEPELFYCKSFHFLSSFFREKMVYSVFISKDPWAAANLKWLHFWRSFLGSKTFSFIFCGRLETFFLKMNFPRETYRITMNEYWKNWREIWKAKITPNFKDTLGTFLSLNAN